MVARIVDASLLLEDAVVFAISILLLRQDQLDHRHHLLAQEVVVEESLEVNGDQLLAHALQHSLVDVAEVHVPQEGDDAVPPQLDDDARPDLRRLP